MNFDKFPEIKDANHTDIEQMIKICAENLIENNQNIPMEKLSQKGFLIKKLTFAEAEEMIDDQKNFLSLVLKKDSDEVLGYITACDIKKTDKNLQKTILQLVEFKKSPKKILYYKQIAKKSGTKNVGKKLLLSMFDKAKLKGYEQLVCQIVHEPFYNKISVEFHQKFGFKNIGFFEEGKSKRGIYLKNLYPIQLDKE